MNLHLSTEPDRQLARLAQQGWTVAELSDAYDPDTFHDRIAAVLGFPEHYGRNLDALWDCLTDLTAPTVIVWRDWSRLAVYHPAWWGRVMPVLRQWAEGSGRELVLTQSGGSPAPPSSAAPSDRPE